MSSVFGSVLILLLVVTLASVLFTSLYSYEEKAQESIDFEEERTQEKINLLSLSTENVGGTEYLVAISVNNTGTITTRIRAIYIDNNFVCDPTNPVLNQNDTYINPKDSLWIIIPNNLRYEPLSQIEVATERGMKSVEYEWKLKSGSQAEPPPETQRFHFGPLLLDFEKFYYTENYGSYDQNLWKPGWSVEKGITLVWNVTVTNIDDRDITINKYSGFTMVSNDGGVQLPWFIEPPDGLDTLFIASNSTVHLIYIWDRPRMTQGVKNQSVYNQNDRSKVFLTFFGIFHEHDGSTKPYGQTIPFEAVLVRDSLIGGISASPTAIAAGSIMTSTVTVTGIRDVMGLIASNVAVNFATTIGTLSSSTAQTNSAGTATVSLYPGTTPGTATVTATWAGVSKSTNVTIALGTLSLTANPTVVAAGSTTSTVTALLTFSGNPLSGETVTFSASGLGTLSPLSTTTNPQGQATTTFTPGSTTGTATITARTLTNTLTQTISVPIINSITVSPSTSTITAGTTRSYIATGSDGLGNSWPITNIVVWGIDSGAGGSWNGATYTSDNAGNWTVTATLGGIYGTATLTVNHASATSITVAPTTATLTSGQSQAYTATAHDAYGNTWDVTSSATWSVVQAGDGGSWVQSTGTYTSSKSGTWTVRTTLGAVSGTSSLTVNPGVASSLTVSGFSNPTTAGSSHTFMVTAKDSYGNTATSYTGTVQFTSTDALAVLPTNYVFISADQGARTFSATLKTTGTQSITVTDTMTATITGSQTGIEVNTAASILIVAGYASPTTAGDSHTLTVTAKDLYGNTATGYRGTVQFTSTDSQAVLPTNYAFTAGDSGIKTFSGVILKMVGTQSITATDTITSSITGSQPGIVVNPGALDHITISPSSAIITAGNSQAFTAQAFDAYSNNLGDVTASTTWSIDAPAGGSWSGATYTSQSAGTWIVTGTYSGFNGVASLTVNHASATSLSISPPSATLTASQSQAYTATASDSYVNTWDATAEISAASGWSVSAGAGGSWVGATYTSGNAGNWTITAILGAGIGTSSLQVNMA